MKIKTEVIDPEELFSMSTDRHLIDSCDYDFSIASDLHTLSTPGPYVGMYAMKNQSNTRNVSKTVSEPELGTEENQRCNNKIKTNVYGTGKRQKKSKYQKRDYVCNYCGKIYHHSTRLKNHVKQDHSKQTKNETLSSAAQESNTDFTQTGEIKGGGIPCRVHDRSHNGRCQHCNKSHRNLDQNLVQHDIDVKCYQDLMRRGSQQKTDPQQTEVLTEGNEYYLTNEEQSGIMKATELTVPPINQPRSGRRTRSSSRLTRSDPTQESADHIRLEVLSYHKDEEMCRRQVMLSGMLFGDRHSLTDQLDNATLKKKNFNLGDEKQVSTSAPDTLGNATDESNIQFWCKCGKSFTSLSSFVVHKFVCEAAVNTDQM